MEIKIAKTSGFCFGVNRAVNIVDDLLSKGQKVCTLGPIIHNPQVVADFNKRGVQIVESSLEIPKESVLIIRSHGITKSAFEYIKPENIKYVDATCPFVKKIHNIVEKNSNNKNFLLIAGDERHPETIGIRSYFSGESFVFNCLEELKILIQKNSFFNKEPALMVAQTTFSTNEWGKCTNFINNLFTNITIFDTICNTTNLRQSEAEFLSKTSDLMIVVGGKESSNTLKLYNICKKNVDTIFVEKLEDVPSNLSEHYSKIGITAGASTPMELVKKIADSIKNSKETIRENEYDE